MSRRGLDELPVGKSEYERADFWIERRDFVDDVLGKPARTLVRLVQHALERGAKSGDGSFMVPVAIDDKLDEERTYGGGSLLVHAAACSTVQILYEDERRYPWLGKTRTALPGLHEKIPNAFLGHPKLAEKDLLERIRVLDDPAFGALNPVTSAEVFWVLIRAGERYAHGTVGFLALFSMLWALERQLHGRFKAGAALGRWRPTVAVTARCLQPILRLIGIIKKRASLYRKAIRDCVELRDHERAGNEYQRWRFASALERLSATLYDLAALSINRNGVAAVAAELTALANPIAPQSATESIAAAVRRQLRALFVELGRQNESILSGADEATNSIAAELIDIMKVDNDRRKVLRKVCNLNPLWKEQRLGAEAARETCSKALKELQRAVTKSRSLPPENAFTHDVLETTLAEFAEINEKVAGILREAIEDNARWCADSVTREVAFASAGNDSEFDAAELLSGLVIAQRTEQITRAAVADAVRHALRAALPDGSWSSDQPIYLEKHFVGVWPRTVDLLDLLSNALRLRHGLLPGPDAADGHLLRFVGLLEARRAKKSPKWWKAPEEVWGFPSEAREDFVDVWETAMAVRGLLKIREVIEDRLWEICEDRFTIPSPKTTLAELDPVDLGARHDRRLQTRLIRNAARTSQAHANPDPDGEEPEYSYVLHGPPGSSKTVIAEAIGIEMWKKSRVVRITPADFTRGGEGGVDLEARFIFRLLSHVRGVTIFFDEIDDLLRKRKIDAELSFIRMVIPGMLNRLQDLRDAAPRQEICFLLATNYIDQIEPALTRRGRVDALVAVPYPDPWSRESILERILAEEQKQGRAAAGLPRGVKDAVVSETAEWPWSTYQKLCRKVVASGCRTVPDVKTLVDRFSGDFESPDYYYTNPERWKETSPLATEFAHFAFGKSKLQHECRKRVADMEQSLRTKGDVPVEDLKLVERFERAWRDAKRG
jgi:hypothetical protein